MATQVCKWNFWRNATFEENSHGNERIVVILGCAISFIAHAQHGLEGDWLFDQYYGAVIISILYDKRIFQCIGMLFCVEFQRVLLKFHTKYFAHTWKDKYVIWMGILRALRFNCFWKSSEIDSLLWLMGDTAQLVPIHFWWLVMAEWLACWTQQWVASRCLRDSRVSSSLLASTSWSNSLIMDVYPAASAQRHFSCLLHTKNNIHDESKVNPC